MEPRDYGERPIPRSQFHKTLKFMERWWAWKGSNLRPRDYESHEHNSHVFSNLKKPKDRYCRTVDRKSDSEPSLAKLKICKGLVDRNRSRTEPIGPNFKPEILVCVPARSCFWIDCLLHAAHVAEVVRGRDLSATDGSHRP